MPTIDRDETMIRCCAERGTQRISTMGISGKYRLHLVAYSDPSDNDFNWALLLTPKREDIHNLNGNCTLYHIVEKMGGICQFERRRTDAVRTGSMLGRVTIGKVDPKHLGTLQKMLADHSRVRVHDPDWDPQLWIEEAITHLLKDKVLQTKVHIDVAHLMEYAQQQSREVLARRLNVGYRLPPTTIYPGPIPLPADFTDLK